MTTVYCRGYGTAPRLGRCLSTFDGTQCAEIPRKWKTLITLHFHFGCASNVDEKESKQRHTCISIKMYGNLFGFPEWRPALLWPNTNTHNNYHFVCWLFLRWTEKKQRTWMHESDKHSRTYSHTQHSEKQSWNEYASVLLCWKMVYGAICRVCIHNPHRQRHDTLGSIDDNKHRSPWVSHSHTHSHTQPCIDLVQLF